MEQITYLAPDTDAYVASVQRHLDEFADRTEIAVDVRIVDSDTYYANEIQGHLQSEGCADVFMSGPVLLWEHVAGGIVEPLDDFIAEGSDEWDLDHFLAPLIRANRWTGRFGDPLGTGPLLEIPINCESYNLVYVPEILERYGVEVPRTWKAYFEAARNLVARSARRINGFGQRGIDVWHTMYTGYATQVWSYGGADFDEDGKCAIASPPVIEATADFISSLQDAGPPHWLDQRWYELAMDVAHGKYGLIVDSDHYVAYFEDEQYSDLVGRVAYAPPPAGPDGMIRPNLFTWSLVMNSHSSRKQAAWRFMEWASSTDFLLRAAFEGNMNPTRASVWDATQFAEHVSAWGDFATVSRDLAENRGEVLVTPAANYRAIASRWVDALREAYADRSLVADALQRAAVDIDSMIG